MVRRGEGKFAAWIKTVSMEPSKCCFSLPGKSAEASTHWAQCERAEWPPPARKGECCRQTYAGKGHCFWPAISLCGWPRFRGLQMLFTELLWYELEHWLMWKTSLWQCTKRRSRWERHALSLLLHRAAIWLFTSSDTPRVVYFDGATAFIFIYSSQKAAALAGIACRLKRLCAL